jgi:hypothetical protein
VYAFPKRSSEQRGAAAETPPEALAPRCTKANHVGFIHGLQRKVGNRIVNRLLHEGSTSLGRREAPISTRALPRMGSFDGGTRNLQAGLLAKRICRRTGTIQKTPEESDSSGSDLGDLGFEPTQEELGRIMGWLENGSVGWQPFTEDVEQNYDLMAEAVLCHRRLEAGRIEEGDPLLCVDEEVTRRDRSFQATRQHIARILGSLPDTTRPLSLDRQSDQVLFAMNLFIEGGPEFGRVGRSALEAVAQVVMNRVACNWPPYGTTPRDVITTPAQFSWTNPGNPFYENAFFPLRRRGGRRLWMICLAIAQQALGGGGVNPGIGMATHYYNPYAVAPAWALRLPFVRQIGNHRFHRGHCPG